MREKIERWIAWHLPRKLVMWCYVRVGANATTGQYSHTVVPELGMMDALQRWDKMSWPIDGNAPEPRPDCKCGHPASYHINFAHEGEPIPPGPPNYPRKQNFCRHPTELTPSGFCACRNYSAPSNPEEPRDCRAYSSDNIGYYCSLPVGHEGDHRAMAGMNTILCAQWAASPLPEEPPRLLTLKESNDPANDNRFSEPCLGCGWTKWAWRNLDAKNCSWCAAEEPPELKTLIEILIATITAPYVEHRQECHDRAHAALVALFDRQREALVDASNQMMEDAEAKITSLSSQLERLQAEQLTPQDVHEILMGYPLTPTLLEKLRRLSQPETKEIT